MPDICFVALSTGAVRSLQNGAADAYDLPPERKISDGDGVPCRHCLQSVKVGEAYLVLAWRPFATLQPYAETGPIFVHAEPCQRAVESAEIPAILLGSPDYIVRGYGRDDRIVYGTGAVTKTADIPRRAADLLARAEVAYVHVRSARNNCYQVRIDRM